MGLVPNGSDLKIVTDRPFIHTGPTNHTVNPFPIRSENWTSKQAGPVLELFRSQMDPSPCKHLDRFLLVLAAQLDFFGTILKASTCILRMFNW